MGTRVKLQYNKHGILVAKKVYIIKYVRSFTSRDEARGGADRPQRIKA